MHAAFIDPFINSTCDVFKTMFACELTRGELKMKENASPAFEFSGVIGIVGRAEGTVVVSLTRETAMLVAEGFLGERTGIRDASIVDSVGELANMIAGGAKSRLGGWGLTIGLPTVLSGKNQVINFPAKAVPIAIPFDSAWGLISVEVGLVY
ncbi:MAG: chemotaxis protein CheX [Planctomycetia bacterium]|nr:chemotaxis protein CheX [Planctomycetia bacterium]